MKISTDINCFYKVYSEEETVKMLADAGFEAIDYTLGTTLGEIDLLSIAAPTNARYLKFVLTDQNYRNVYSISLQKIRIF